MQASALLSPPSFLALDERVILAKVRSGELRGEALNVFINDPSVVPDLRAHLEAAGCLVRERDAYYLEVRLPRIASDLQAQREVDVFVATWQALNPGVEAYVVELDELPVDGGRSLPPD
jgi:hypothetical protein